MEAAQVITITFGDQSENHKGMQKIGQIADCGFNLEDLSRAKTWFDERNVTTELIALHEHLPANKRHDSCNAWILIARGGLDAILGGELSGQFLAEQLALNWDKKAFMYGRVVNKNARYNLCYSDEAQDPNYEEKRGRIYPFRNLPLLAQVREKLPELLGGKAANLQCEGNLYYDVTKCGIGYHGDTERMKVVAIRVGATMPLHYTWFQNGAAISAPIELSLNHGDFYVMSEKAGGHDWKRKVVPTLRHAAGCPKFLALAPQVLHDQY